MFDEYECDDDVFRTGLRQVVVLRAVLCSLESELVIGARLRGYRWNALAEDLGLTPGGARKRHLAIDPIPMRNSEPEPTLAQALAELTADHRT